MSCRPDLEALLNKLFGPEPGPPAEPRSHAGRLRPPRAVIDLGADPKTIRRQTEKAMAALLEGDTCPEE